jgi:peptide/nickel transport system substrate-binding protein
MFAALAFAGLGGVSSAAPFVFPDAWSVSPTGAGESRGTLREGSTSEPRGFNPFTDPSAPVVGGVNGSRGLFITDPVTGDTVPYMAQRYTVSENRLRWTMTLRPDMRWSDGTPVTAEDWVTTARIHSDRALSTNQRERFFVEGKPVTVTSEGDSTVVFTFPKVVVNALDTLSVPPQPAHVFRAAYDANGAAGVRALWGVGENPSRIVTAGAFKLSNFEPGVRSLYVRNPYFSEWNATTAAEALPHLDRVETRYYRDRAAMLEDYLDERLDTFTTSNPLEVARLQSSLNNGTWRGTLRLNALAGGATTWMTFNWNRQSDPFKQTLFRSAAFRQAISHLVNRERIVKEVYGGLATAQYGALTTSFGDWVAPDLERYAFDPEAAAKLLATLGFRTRNRDGLLETRDYRTIEFEVYIPNNSPESERAMEIIRSDALEVGVRITVTAVSPGVLINLLTAPGEDRPWDAVYSALAFNTPGVYPLNGAYYSCFGRLHFFNTSGDCIDPLETQGMLLFDRGRQTLDLKARREIVRETQTVTARLQAVIHVVALTTHAAWQARVRGELSTRQSDTTRWLELTWLGR